MQRVGKAAMGNTTRMEQWGVALDENMTDQEKFQAVLQAGVNKFAIAEGQTTTFGGILKQLGNAWGDAKEKMGAYIGENTYLKSTFEVITFSIQNMGDVFRYVYPSVVRRILRNNMGGGQRASRRRCSGIV